MHCSVPRAHTLQTLKLYRVSANRVHFATKRYKSSQMIHIAVVRLYQKRVKFDYHQKMCRGPAGQKRILAVPLDWQAHDVSTEILATVTKCKKGTNCFELEHAQEEHGSTFRLASAG